MAGEAAAIGWPVVNGATTPANTVAAEINTSRDLAATVYSETRPVARGGTGGTSAADARTALGVVAAADVVVSTGGGALANKIPRFDANARLAASNPVSPSHVATKAYVDAAAAPAFNGGVVTNDIYLPNASLAVTGYTNAYLDYQGRICRGASSSRWKKTIDRAPVPDGFTELVTSYLMRADADEVTRYGPIVEDMVKAGGKAAALVTYDAKGLPESFDQISFLMACVAELRGEITALRAQIEGA